MGYPAIATIHDQHDDHGGLRELGQSKTACANSLPTAC